MGLTGPPGTAAMAWSVMLLFTVIGPVYFVEYTVGVTPVTV
jgi:hypothetical protein